MFYTEEYPYKLEIDVIAPVSRTVTKPFKTLKILRQWQQRDYNRFVLGTGKGILPATEK